MIAMTKRSAGIWGSKVFISSMITFDLTHASGGLILCSPIELAVIYMQTPITIGVIGDFNVANPTHVAKSRGIEHAARALNKPIHTRWLATDETHHWEQYHALI